MAVTEGPRSATPDTDVGDLIVVHETVWSVHVLHLFGDVDVTNAAALAWEIENSPPALRLVINLSNCNYLDVCAMRMLGQVLQARGDAVRIVGPPGSAPARAIGIAQMDLLLPVFPSFLAALQ